MTVKMKQRIWIAMLMAKRIAAASLYGEDNNRVWTRGRV
jgi:hypothetical protein